MADLIVRPEHSLIHQSFHAQERKEPLNGDGFGIGWYAHEIEPEPGVFTSITPAWSNRNLHRLADKISSDCFFAHVRAATRGMSVDEVNCHPFQFGRFLWMHNGRVGSFSSIRRRLRASLPDRFYDIIQGTTDSEHSFALFLSHLYERIADYDTQALADSMRWAIERLSHWAEEAGVSEPSFLNLAVTDGRSVVATRHVSDPSRSPASLYYASGERLEDAGGVSEIVPADGPAEAVFVASEPVTASREPWREVPVNHLVVVTPELHVKLEAIG